VASLALMRRGPAPTLPLTTMSGTMMQLPLAGQSTKKRRAGQRSGGGSASTLVGVDSIDSIDVCPITVVLRLNTEPSIPGVHAKQEHMGVGKRPQPTSDA